MSTYGWKIDSTNSETNTMQVTYTYDTKVTTLNLQIPALGVNVAEWIDKFAPRSTWEVVPTDAIVVGTEGLGVVALPEPEPAPEPASVTGSVNEEYLRALIFQVLQEVQAAQV